MDPFKIVLNSDYLVGEILKYLNEFDGLAFVGSYKPNVDTLYNKLINKVTVVKPYVPIAPIGEVVVFGADGTITFTMTGLSTARNNNALFIGAGSSYINTDFSESHLRGTNRYDFNFSENILIIGCKSALRVGKYSRIRNVSIVGSDNNITVDDFVCVENLNIIGNNLNINFKGYGYYENVDITGVSTELIYEFKK